MPAAQYLIKTVNYAEKVVIQSYTGKFHVELVGALMEKKYLHTESRPQGLFVLGAIIDLPPL